MLLHCFKCKKKTESKNPKFAKTNKGRTAMLLSKRAVCGSNKLRFIKEQEFSGLLSNLGIKILILSYIPLVGDSFLKI